ncbi:hypothetical protein [Levilactobacillus spicheri]|uniref:hypothetical protein n=1 Tax=Levilactobacillus spicheri TaxID=216463 RepID=UPI0012E08A2F|nr:hypothetical protein [Levilactobacillus spicheri]
MKTTDCPLCHGTQVVPVVSAFGVEFNPCPNCNVKFKQRVQKEFEAMKRKDVVHE